MPAYSFTTLGRHAINKNTIKKLVIIIKVQPSVFRFFARCKDQFLQNPRQYFSIALISIVVLVTDDILPLPHFSIFAMGVFGIALSLFFGFKTIRYMIVGGKHVKYGEA